MFIVLGSLCACAYIISYINGKTGLDFSFLIVCKPCLPAYCTCYPQQSYVFVGEHVYIGENSIVNCAQVGSYVHIGKNCVLGRLSMLKDCCAILDGTVLAPDTVVPPFAVFAGNPGKQVGELPEITQELMIDFTWSFYRNLLPMSKKPPEQEDANKS